MDWKYQARVQETQESLKKRLKKKSRVSNAQQMVKRMLKRLGVQEKSEESKTVALEDVLNERKISEKVPVMLDTQKILKTLNRLKKVKMCIMKLPGMDVKK